VGDFELLLPAEHLLPEYQAAHPLYDRFLTHLAAQLPAGAAVVDVGANCGDTLAALLGGQAALEVLCIEPDAGFFTYLAKNAESLQRQAPLARVHLVQAMVGTQPGALQLTGQGGTRKATPATPGQGMATQRLDDIVAAQSPEFSARLRLIKSDVDGWDHEVITSAFTLWQTQAPMLFFECQTDTDSQRQAYTQLLQRLFASRELTVYAFDNFGALMSRCHRAAPLVELIDYVWAQNQRRASRTVYYLDLLVCSAADLPLAERALASHLA
jgi:FkbM family methyltransferase